MGSEALPWWSLLGSLVLFCWAGTASGFTWTAARWVGRIARRTEAERALPIAQWPALAILRPCEGRDAGLEQNLLSSVTAPYAGERRVILLCPTRDDPAWAVAERVRERARSLAPSVRVELRVTAVRTEGNRKVAQLAAVERELTEPVVVTADSDIRFGPEVLSAMVRALLADGKNAGAMAPPIELEPQTFGDRLSSAMLSSTPHAFLALSGLGERAGGAQFLCGAVVAYRREPLEEVGGFAALESYLGEDFELARRFTEHGYRVTTTAVPAGDHDGGRSLDGVIKKFARWSTVTRSQKPGLFPTYFLLLGATPLIVVAAALVAWVQPLFWFVGVAQTAVLVGSRLFLARRMRRLYGLPVGLLQLVGLVFGGELLLLAGATGALGSPVVEWRGHRYRVDEGGLMRRLEAEAAQG
jgi:ceramide glucosyltransferase